MYRVNKASSGNIKLLVIDLDGTLLRDDKTISEYTTQVLKLAKTMGITLCYATGRSKSMTKLYSDMIGGCDYIITDNGAYVEEVATHKILRSLFLPEKSCHQVVAHLMDSGIDFSQYTLGCVYLFERKIALEKRLSAYESLSAKLGYPDTLVRKSFYNPSQHDHKGVLKIVAYQTDINQQLKLQHYIDGISGLVQEETGYGLTGIFKEGASKQSALELIIDYLGISTSQVCTFGDYLNDLGLFEICGHRVAPMNAIEEVKAKATAICGYNNDDGVAKYIEEFIL